MPKSALSVCWAVLAAWGAVAGVTIQPGAGWTPLSGESEVLKGSALDFAGFGGQRVPAGSLGRVVARGSHFEFEKAPGVARRFYGVNFCFTGNFMSADEAEELCTRLERIGYNAIRIHHYERPLCEGAADGTTINPQRMSELDNLLNAAIRHGLYVTTDLYVSRQVPYRSCGIDREGVIPMREFKELVLCHEGVRSNLVVFTKALLGHVNPATGRRWADEPALMSISLVNENNPGNHGFDFLRKTLGITAEQMADARFAELVAEKVAAFDREMIRVLKEEIGYRGLVTGLNGWHNPPCYRALRKAYDYVDDHFYVDHPEFLEKPWRLPSKCRNANPLTYGNPGINWDKEAWVRHSDRPYTITEWNFSGPGRYRGAGGIVFGAGAALQEMDGVWRFAWSHSHDRLLKDGKLTYFDAATDPLMLATERAIIALYLRGDLPADRSVKKPTDACRWLTADLTNGTFTIATPLTAGVFAEPSERKHRMGPLQVTVQGHSAAVWATSLDGRPLAESRRLLVTHVTDVQDAGTVYRAADRKVLEKWGDLPHLMANGTSEIVLDTAQPLRVYALKADGTRLGEVKTHGRGLAFTADVARDPKAATYLYELVADGADAWMKDAAAFRRELRAFYPDECHENCKDPRQTNSVARIGRALDEWAAKHPDYDALDVRREEYLQVRRHVQPFLFKTSPFYFELGCNGGWTHNWQTVPGRHVNRLCRKFYKEQSLIPESAFALQQARQALTLALCCGPFVDDMHHVPPFRTILTKGFKGVRDEVAAALAKCPADDPLGRKELETALVGLDTIQAIQLKFHEEAKAEVEKAGGGGERKRLLRIVEASARCPWEPPRTFYEGLNTLWFVREVLGYLDGTDQFSLGRPDCYFIDLYRKDLAEGRLTREEARELVAKFLLTAELHHDGLRTLDSYCDHEMEIPMSVGGFAPDGTWVCNELTEMILDAHLGCGCVFPKLHARISSKAPAAYLEKIGHMLMEGHAVFTLLNDDRFVKQFADEGYPIEDARSYIGVGCWNGMIDSVMDYSGGNYLSIMKILEMTIHRDPAAEARAQLAIDPLDGATSYEEVRERLYRNTIRFLRHILGEYARWGRANAKVFPHPVYTMCLRGGTESRRDTTDGGIPAQPRIVTLGFLNNVVDCLSSIRQLCFVDKVCTLDELLAAVRSNWQGPRGEELRLRAMAAPSWGDNSPETNGELALWVNRINADVEGMRTEQGYPWKFAIYTYREFLYWGLQMKATPDGRRAGDRLAQGFSPSEYRCKSGLTTVINAIGSAPHEGLYASNANLTFDRTAMNEKNWAAVLRVYCGKGAHMIQPNCNSVEELLDAQKHPERHQDLIVRVCGFSARFVALSKRWQDEVIARHRLR